ncbi:MAG: InlB B-repeat-containing protein, partial [Acholeplasmataceae bacterium]|nr:InlB B-repeat-containing protein [Acholeplasmataceae bacterium]
MKKQVYLFFLFIVLLTLSACNGESIDFLVSFDSNGGTIVESIQYQGEETFDIPTQITKEGHTFDGWYLDNNYTDAFRVELLVDGTIDDDVTLYAKWLINQYQIIYVDDDQTVIETLSYDFGADLSAVTHPSSPEKEGHTFASWDQALPSSMPASNITLQAVYTKNGYTLSYIDFDDTVLLSMVIDFDTDLSNESEPTSPQREGYTFTGWDREKPDTMPAQDLTLQATYTINQYNIYYVDFNDQLISFVSVDFGTDLSEHTYPNNPSREGYTFTGWSGAIPSTMPAEDIIIEAEYSINSYMLTFRNTDESIVYSQSYNYGSNLSDITLPEGPTKAGYSFTGWLYQDEIWTHQDVIITEDITLYPSYDLLNYTINYNLNGGAFGSLSPILNYTVESEFFYLVEPTKEGYDFAGWYKSSNFSGEPISSITKGSIGILTLYAIWTEFVSNIFDSEELNDIFGFNIYLLMPEILTSDYVLLDYSETNYFEVYIDLFDWSEDDAFDYIDLLDTMLDYDNTEDSWMIGDYFLYVYEDDQTYEGIIVYGIGIYGDASGSSEPHGPFNSENLNTIFGFDIYALIPSIVSIVAAIVDLSTNTNYDVYIVLFEWTE